MAYETEAHRRLCADGLVPALVRDRQGAVVNKYRTILADPPWQLSLGRPRRRAKGGFGGPTLPYPTMSLDRICALPVADLADSDCHLWLWTTNQHLEHGFQVMRSWGFRYIAPINRIKPSGQGNWFIHRSQTLLFGYRSRCVFPLERYKPNVLVTGGRPLRHSEKPTESFRLIESISAGPRLELFARQRRLGWHSWGNEVASDVEMVA
jgi:N6-adenosine-specific RNA methylase IME4